METIILDKKEYSELTKVRDMIEKILISARKKRIIKEDGLLEAFGVFRKSSNGNSLNYISEIRKEWR